MTRRLGGGQRDRTHCFCPTAVTLNSEQSRLVFGWFRYNLHIAALGGWANTFSVEWCGGDRKAEIVRFLRETDLAIDDLRVGHEDFSPETIPGDLPAELRQHLRGMFSGTRSAHVHVRHNVNHDRSAELELEEGVRRDPKDVRARSPSASARQLRSNG